jgi:hypothetical protein
MRVPGHKRDGGCKLVDAQFAVFATFALFAMIRLPI